MQSLPHPNQVRSACERCRKLKLRCPRRWALTEAGAVAPCSRCEDLGLECLLGAQRKVGRPTKKVDARRAAESPAVVEVQPDLDDAFTPSNPDSVNGMAVTVPQQQQQQYPFDTLDALDSMDWILPEGSGFDMEDFNVLPSLTDDHTPSSSTSTTNATNTNSNLNIDPALSPPPSLDATVIRLTDNSHFRTLSKINMELHDLWRVMSMQPANGTLEGFVCDCNLEFGNTLKPYQSLMKTSQDYLLAIKALHKTLGIDTDALKPRAIRWEPLACRITTAPATPDPASTSSSSSSSSSASSACKNCQKPAEPALAPDKPSSQRVILDSPTALLVISCFSQIVQHFEIFFSVSITRLLDPDASLIPPAIASFAGVPVVEFITQGAIFAEMMRGNFGQMMLVLGLPTDSWWMGKTVWTGLLKEQRYRDLLNSELGAVENGWTTRPQKLMKTIKDCQGLIDECMMSGCAG